MASGFLDFFFVNLFIQNGYAKKLGEDANLRIFVEKFSERNFLILEN